MNATHFRALGRLLGNGMGRRTALIGLLGAVLIAGPDGLSKEDAAARRKRKKKKKKKRSQAQDCAATCAGCCDGNGACQVGTDSTACGASGAACVTCTGETVCSAGTCVPAPCGGSVPCRVFVTSTTHQGNLGGLAGADAICQARASTTGLPGTYKAWLSDNTSTPSTRFVQSTGPYRRIDGVTVADSFADLTDGSLDAPINVTETGAVISADVETWTSTKFDGTRAANGNCDEWTSPVAGVFTATFGSATSSNSTWTTLNVTSECNHPRRLYCFQQS